MLNSAFHRCGLTILLGVGLTACGCDSSGKGSNPETSKPKVESSHTTDTPTAPEKLPADAPMEKVILGQWVSQDADTFTWHFAADGSFVVRSTDKTDLTRFPEALRNKTDAFMGNWKLTDAEIVLSAITGQGQTLMKELRVPYKKISNQEIEIDGAKFSRKSVMPAEPANSDGADHNG